MKSYLILIAGFISIAVTAQKNSSFNQSVNDDGKKLSIKIKGNAEGKPVHYNHSFNVTGMSSDQKDSIKQHVYDSLGIAMPVAPSAPLAPITPRLEIEPIEPIAPLVIANTSVPTITSKSQYTELYTIGGDHPYTKEIKYNPKTGLLYMKYRFIKNGEETTVEKSVEARDKSKEEREQIIKKYEKEIGVAQPDII